MASRSLAFIKPYLSNFMKKWTIQLVTAAIPHLHEPSHETKSVLIDFLTRFFDNQPREYNKLVWEHIDESTPQLTKRQNDILYELVFSVKIPWDGLDFTGNIRQFVFPWHAAGKWEKRHRRAMRKKFRSRVQSGYASPTGWASPPEDQGRPKTFFGILRGGPRRLLNRRKLSSR